MTGPTDSPGRSPDRAERVEYRRTVDAPPDVVFALLCRPDGHVAIDSSGMLQSAEGDPVRAVGDRFVVHMDREALGDVPMGRYDVEVIITGYEPDRLLEWTISGTVQPPIGHRYGYRLEPADDGRTLATSYCDWSRMLERYRGHITFPVVPASALRASMGILARTVRR